jgi:hypothetical protein
MLQVYKRKAWKGIAVFLLADLVAIVGYINIAPRFAAVFLLLLLIGFAGACYAITCFAKGKGYSTLYAVALIVVPALLANVLLPRSSRAGLAGLATILGLLLLPDKHPLVQTTESAGPTWRDNLAIASRIVANWFRAKQ